MKIEKIELTMSHIGLGTLNEYALMVLFGNAHSHHLVAGLEITPDKIKDNNGLMLYPAYFMTYLKIPVHSPLINYKLWDTVEVGVDVKRFGQTILESTYILGREGEISDNIDQWNSDKFPCMYANNLFVIDVIEEVGKNRHVSNPHINCIVDLPKLKKTPHAVKKSIDIRVNGFDEGETSYAFKNDKPIIYHVINGRDAAPGHAMIFAKFAEIMDYAEFKFLSENMYPGVQSEVLYNVTLLEREIYYYANCFAGETLEIYLKGNIENIPDNYNDDQSGFIYIAILKFQFEIYKKSNKELLAIGRNKKNITIPNESQNLIYDVKRLLFQYI